MPFTIYKEFYDFTNYAIRFIVFVFDTILKRTRDLSLIKSVTTFVSFIKSNSYLKLMDFYRKDQLKMAFTSQTMES